jgi:hypothetical protein
MQDKSNAHIKTKPKFAPAILAVVTVPGPIKAAATSIPGPNLFMVKNQLFN